MRPSPTAVDDHIHGWGPPLGRQTGRQRQHARRRGQRLDRGQAWQAWAERTGPGPGLPELAGPAYLR